MEKRSSIVVQMDRRWYRSRTLTVHILVILTRLYMTAAIRTYTHQLNVFSLSIVDNGRPQCFIECSNCCILSCQTDGASGAFKTRLRKHHGRAEGQISPSSRPGPVESTSTDYLTSRLNSPAKIVFVPPYEHCDFHTLQSSRHVTNVFATPDAQEL